jgi:hypothetical protein
MVRLVPRFFSICIISFVVGFHCAQRMLRTQIMRLNLRDRRVDIQDIYI